MGKADLSAGEKPRSRHGVRPGQAFPLGGERLRPCPMSLRLHKDGAIARLLIDRPERHNAFSLAMWQALPALLAEAEADRAVGVILLGSALPGLFCAGADIGELFAAREDAAAREALLAAILAAQAALAACSRPTVAFVDGDAMGGGCGLALACDIRVASARARFGVTPARLGLVYPLHDTALLVDLVGVGQARRLMFSGMVIGAAEALALGLIEEIAESAEGLVAGIAANSAFSLGAIKHTLRRVMDGQRVDDRAAKSLFLEAFTQGDFGERAAAFLTRKGQ